MKITIDGNFAKSIMKDYNRDYFTTTALETILNYYDEIDESTEFDPVAICCDWNEYGNRCALTLADMFSDYGYLLDDDDDSSIDDENKLEKLIEILEDRTYIIKLDNGNILMHVF